MEKWQQPRSKGKTLIFSQALLCPLFNGGTGRQMLVHHRYVQNGHNRAENQKARGLLSDFRAGFNLPRADKIVVQILKNTVKTPGRQLI